MQKKSFETGSDQMPILPLMKYDIRRVGARPPTQPRYLRPQYAQRIIDNYH